MKAALVVVNGPVNVFVVFVNAFVLPVAPVCIGILGTVPLLPEPVSLVTPLSNCEVIDELCSVVNCKLMIVDFLVSLSVNFPNVLLMIASLLLMEKKDVEVG